MRYLIFITLIMSYSLFADSRTLFNEACKEYDQQNYSQAVIKFQSIIQSGVESGEIYYNLGNSYYKSNDIVNALVCYEKALKLAGNDEDLKANLAITRQKIIDKAEDKPVLPIFEFLANIKNNYNIYSIKTLILISSLFLSIAISLLIWFRGFKSKLFITVLASLSCLALIPAVFFAYGINKSNRLEFGIISVEKSTVNASPDENANNTELFSLHKGAKVQVHRKIDGWIEVSFAKDKKGWIEASSLINI